MKKHHHAKEKHSGGRHSGDRPHDRLADRLADPSRDRHSKPRDRSRDRARVTKQQPKMDRHTLYHYFPSSAAAAPSMVPSGHGGSSSMSTAAAAFAAVTAAMAASSGGGDGSDRDDRADRRGGGGPGRASGLDRPRLDRRFSAGSSSFSPHYQRTTVPPPNYPVGQREMLRAVAQQTLDVLPDVLEPLGRMDQARAALKYTDRLPRLHPRYCPRFPRRATVRVVDNDTLNEAVRLAREKHEYGSLTTLDTNMRPLVVNFANRHNPGGGWLNGAMAQEEALCYRSSLALSLRRELYPLARSEVLYSPYVLVIRSDKPSGHKLLVSSIPIDQLTEVSCVTVAAIKGPEVRSMIVVEGAGQNSSDQGRPRGGHRLRRRRRGDGGWREDEIEEDDGRRGRRGGDGLGRFFRDDADLPPLSSLREQDSTDFDDSREGRRRSRSHSSFTYRGAAGGGGDSYASHAGSAGHTQRCRSVEMADDPDSMAPRIVTADPPPPYVDVTTSRPPSPGQAPILPPRDSSPPSSPPGPPRPSHPPSPPPRYSSLSGTSSANPLGGGSSSSSSSSSRGRSVPQAREKLIYARDYERDMTKAKMRLTLRAAATNGHDQLVLGALGCGVFGNPPEDVAHCWLEVLREDEFAGNWWRDVVFAVYSGNQRTNAADGSNFGIFHRVLDGQRV